MADYIAKSPILIDGVAAYQPGDTVAADVVDRLKLADSVAKAGTKAAEHAVPESGRP